MRKLILNSLFALTFLPISIFANDDLSIKARAFVTSKDDISTLRIGIVLINNSDKEITVLTKPDGRALTRDARGLLTQATMGSEMKVLGHKITPSLDLFEPVTLRPNEAAFIAYNMASSQEIEDQEEIRVRYSIQDELAERYNLWGETLTAVTTVAVP